MLFRRVITALVGIPLALAAAWEGHISLFIITALVIILGIMELNNLFQKTQVSPSLVLALTGSLLFLLSALINPDAGYTELIVTFVVLLNIAAMALLYPRYQASGAAATVFMTFYLGWMITHIYLLRQVDKGFYFLLLLLFTTWATDTFAYFTGMAIGRHKLAPMISPKKTIEGSVGGVAGAVLVAVVFFLVRKETAIFNYVTLGLLVGIVGQIGDLAESALKRIAHVKDSGNLLPGHGGILDRFDSLLFTAPTVYYYLKLFIIV